MPATTAATCTSPPRSEVSARIGAIGTGAIGASHVRMLDEAVDGATVVAVADVDTGRANAVAGAGRRVFADGRELIASDDVEAVVIAAPDRAHEDLLHACLAAGKPALCEKPLTTSAAASLGVADAEASLGRRLVSVGFMRRFDPAYLEVKRGLDEDAIGGVLLIHCAHRNPSVPRGFGPEMLITSSLSHEIDVVRWLTGEEVVRVTVLAGRPTSRAATPTRDPLLVILETERGVLVDVEVFGNAGYGYDIRCELVGEAGTLTLASQLAPGFLERFADAYRRELQAWVDGLNGPRPGCASAWDGYAADAVADACVESLHSGSSTDVRPLQRTR